MILFIQSQNGWYTISINVRFFLTPFCFQHENPKSSVWSKGLCAPHKKGSIHLLVCCSSQWNHFTQSHVVNCVEEIRPTAPCTLSATCEGGVSIWELCCCTVHKREGHITQSCLVLFWSNSHKKRTACLKGSVSMPLMMSITLTGLWCKQWWQAKVVVLWQIFQNQSQVMCLASWTGSPFIREHSTHPPHHHNTKTCAT